MRTSRSLPTTRAARRAYFANVSYLDEKIGRLLGALERAGMQNDTVVVFCADHGDMLGERGLWFKMSFFEGSARVPLMIAGPGIGEALCREPVSLLDIAPTIAELAGVDGGEFAAWSDGQSLAPVLGGERRTAPVLMEYAAEGSVAPLVSIRRGRFKFNHCEIDPPQLFDLEADPAELRNLAEDSEHAETVASFAETVEDARDLSRFDHEVRDSQARRWVVYEALRQGRYHPRDFEPEPMNHDRYMRNHMDLNVVEERARFPRDDSGDA
ncbi:MAG: sulfatase-like hydrolase/transferase [Gammaproteobacteria bacterium]|nr:sulfatase-like hydrolase/transferase [Gammaproteobacteria bacterium]